MTDEELKKAADELALRAFPEKKSYSSVYDRVVDYNAVDRKNYRDGIIVGAKWQAEHAPLPEDTVIYNKGVEEGKRLMMDEAEEGEVMLNPYPTICLDDCKDYDFKDGDRVRVIICKKED